jgi:hypothetical protein
MKIASLLKFLGQTKVLVGILALATAIFVFDGLELTVWAPGKSVVTHTSASHIGATRQPSASPTPSDSVKPYVDILSRSDVALASEETSVDSACANPTITACESSLTDCSTTMTGIVSNLDNANPPMSVRALNTQLGTTASNIALDCKLALGAMHNFDSNEIQAAFSQGNVDDRAWTSLLLWGVIHR